MRSKEKNFLWYEKETDKSKSNKCFYCELTFGSSPTKRSAPLIKTNDHIIPRSHNGLNHPINYVNSCHQCNYLKGSRLPEEFSEFLEYKIIETKKVKNSKNCFSVKRLERILINNKKIIATIEPYRDELIRKFNPDELKVLNVMANKLTGDNLRERKSGKILKNIEKKLTFTGNPIELNNWIQKYLSEPEPNFHYQ